MVNNLIINVKFDKYVFEIPTLSQSGKAFGKGG
jgi:hypothetical protein